MDTPKNKMNRYGPAAAWAWFCGRPLWHRTLRVFSIYGKRAALVAILVLLVLWLVGGLLGLFLDPRAELSFSWFAHGVYRLLSFLIDTRELGSESSSLLKISRFCGLVAAVVFAAGGLGRWTTLLIARLVAGGALSGHMVIIGLGGAGRSLLEDLAHKRPGMVVVALEPDGSIAATVRAALLGALVIEGRGEDKNIYRVLATHKARFVFISTGSDSRNVEIAGKIRQHYEACKGWKSSKVEIVPLINDSLLLRRIYHDKNFLGPQKKDGAGIVPFSSDESAVRKLFQERPIGELTRLTPARRAHLVLFGFGNLGEMVLLHGLQAALRPDLGSPIATVLTPDAAKARTRFFQRYPGLQSSSPPNGSLNVEIRFLEWDPDNFGNDVVGREEKGEEKGEEDGEKKGEKKCLKEGLKETLDEWPDCPATAIFVCLDSDDQGLSVALGLQNITDRTRTLQAPIFVCLGQDTGLSDALSPCKRELKLSAVIDDFGLDREICTFSEIFERPGDRLFEKLHQDYGKFVRELKLPAGEPESPRTGTAYGRKHIRLRSSTYFRANIAQADHVRAKLHALGYRPVASQPEDDRSVLPAPFPVKFKNDWIYEKGKKGEDPGKTILEEFGKLEHDRWMLERLEDGWRPGLERDNVEKIHNALKPWDGLTSENRYKDTRHILELESYVDRPWRRDFLIGAVGPVHLGKTSSQTAISDALKEIQLPEDAAVTLVSPLAPGLDIEFVKAGLEFFKDRHVRLIVPRAVPFEVSEQCLKDKEARESYKQARKEILEGGLPCGESSGEDFRQFREYSWIIDLLPPGISERCVMDVPEGTYDPKEYPQKQEKCQKEREKNRELQYQRATAYVVERSDHLLLFVDNEKGETEHVQLARSWWNHPVQIPKNLCSGPDFRIRPKTPDNCRVVELGA